MTEAFECCTQGVAAGRGLPSDLCARAAGGQPRRRRPGRPAAAACARPPWAPDCARHEPAADLQRHGPHARQQVQVRRGAWACRRSSATQIELQCIDNKHVTSDIYKGSQVVYNTNVRWM